MATCADYMELNMLRLRDEQTGVYIWVPDIFQDRCIRYNTTVKGLRLLDAYEKCAGGFLERPPEGMIPCLKAVFTETYYNPSTRKQEPQLPGKHTCLKMQSCLDAYVEQIKSGHEGRTVIKLSPDNVLYFLYVPSPSEERCIIQQANTTKKTLEQIYYDCDCHDIYNFWAGTKDCVGSDDCILHLLRSSPMPMYDIIKQCFQSYYACTHPPTPKPAEEEVDKSKNIAYIVIALIALALLKD